MDQCQATRLELRVVKVNLEMMAFAKRYGKTYPIYSLLLQNENWVKGENRMAGGVTLLPEPSGGSRLRPTSTKPLCAYLKRKTTLRPWTLPFFHFLFTYLPGVMLNHSKQFSTDTTMHAAESTLLAAPTTHVRTRTSPYTIKMTPSLMSFTVVSSLSASPLLGGAILSCDALIRHV